MKKKNLVIVLLLACTQILFSYDLPKGLVKAGSQPEKYDMGTDKGAGRNGENAATIKSLSKDINGFGTLMQSSVPGKYLGKRVRMIGYVKSENVDDWAGLWLRIDNDKSRPESFDNMHDRPIKGNTSWKKYEIVLDVPKDAVNLSYGALLSGIGQIWFSDIKFEIVDKSVSLTGSMGTSLKKPTNLNFNK